MRIKQIQLQGFKSFVDKTALVFESPISAIVGPNGTGKSNVVDAVRWVLGEQSSRHLRGHTMEDVIFSGSDARSPMGMASVSLTLSNEDQTAPPDFASYSEITVGRRLYRTGESEYSINKTICRLRDIVDLFLGTGAGHKAYSIIEQGHVDFIVQAKPEERRILIEEAAGISKFRVRKEAALKRIELTEANLARLIDMVGEVKRQLGVLERQAKKAEQFRVMKAELKDADLKVASTRYRASQEECHRVDQKLGELEVCEAGFKATLSQGETRQETARIEQAELERDLSEAQGHSYEMQNQMRLAEAEIEFKKKEIERLEADIERFLSESEEARTKLGGLTEERATHLETYDEAIATQQAKKSRLRELTGVFEELSGTHRILAEGLAAKSEELMEVTAELSSVSSRVQGMEDRKAHLKGAEASATAARRELEIRWQAVQKAYHEAVETSAELARLHAQRGAETAEMTTLLAQEQGTLSGLEEEYHRIKEEIASKRSRLKSLEEMERSLEGYPQGVRRFVEREREKGSPSNLVADIVKIPKEYETAVAAALGDRFGSIVVKDQAVGVEAVEYLRHENMGRSTFIPREPRFYDKPVPEPIPQGVMGPLAHHVQIEQGYELVGHYLFADYLLVKDLRTALELWSSNGHRKTFVTLDGELIDPHGVISGGVPENIAREILSKKRQIEELKGENRDLSDDLQYKDEEVAAHNARIAALEFSSDTLKKEGTDREMKILAAEKDLERMRMEILELERQILELETERNRAAAELEVVERDCLALAERQTALAARQKELERGIASERALEEGVKERLAGLSHELTDLRILLAGLEEKVASRSHETERLKVQEDDLNQLLENRRLGINQATASIAELKTEIATLDRSREELLGKSHSLHTRVEELSRRFEDLKGSQETLEAEMREARSGLGVVSEQLRVLGVRRAEHAGRMTALRDQILDKYSTDLAQGYAEGALPAPIMEALEARAGELREKLETMGDVYLGAPEEYAEVKSRFDHLNGQTTDLAAALEGLRQAIHRINRASKKRLAETFDLINERFQALYPKLFNGGRARLILTDENNLLSSGVEIIAQPPGKKLQNVSLLSGGEKALTAIALIFAMFLVRPSPFCFLDEVDAPLDDANIDRFNTMIREMSGQTQFILVTHNKRTMENADLLYGVTMQEAGVSKVVAVRLADEPVAAAS